MTRSNTSLKRAESRVAESCAAGYCAAKIVWAIAASVLCALLVWPDARVNASAEADAPQRPGSASQIVAAVVSNELVDTQNNRDHYAYFSVERSDRTGGHLWMEKVVETSVGKVRMLREEDGQPLSAERMAQERGRLAAIVADPSAFVKRAQTIKDDEAHARQMLTLVSRAFLFGDAREEGGFLCIDFRPNPEYETRSIEERVLHAMTGTMLIDPQRMRLHHIEARLPTDVNIGFGLLATIRAGSNFSTTRDRLGEPDFKTTQLDTDINGRAIFFKSIAKKQHSEHSNFVRVPDDVTVAQAVAIAED